jgi:hypothetical protein
LAEPTRTFEGFSISHAAILNGTTGAMQSWGDVYGVRDGSLEVDTDSYDNTGDEAVLSTWYWFNFATVTVTAGYVPFDLIAGISGDTVTASSAAAGQYYSVPMWSESSLNEPRRPMIIRVPSKDATTAGATRTFDFVLYSVQFEPFSFDGPTYKDGMLLNYSGRALMSSTDEKGATLAQGRAIGRIVNRPGSATGTDEVAYFTGH